jgi:hypothetical protein
MARKETYPEARSRLFAEFRALGCRVKDQLVVPQVELPCGETLMFHKQAVHTKSDGLSTWLDIRGMSAESLKYKTEKKRTLSAKEYFSEAGGTSNPIL